MTNILIFSTVKANSALKFDIQGGSNMTGTICV
jgi:hypothetical protein